MDEALLECAESGLLPQGVLRFWESPEYFIVLGRSSKPEIEVDLAACREAGVGVYRRPSGGGTVLSGPGCMSYAVVLDFETFPRLRSISHAHEFVLGRIANALASHVPSVELAGTSDLVVDIDGGPAKKFSGNALRIKRNHLLYHGTMLYDFNLDQAERLLATPTRAPDYRKDRSHRDFITNLPLDRTTIQEALQEAWNAQEPLTDWPRDMTAELAKDKYERID